MKENFKVLLFALFLSSGMFSCNDDDEQLAEKIEALQDEVDNLKVANSIIELKLLLSNQQLAGNAIQEIIEDTDTMAFSIEGNQSILAPKELINTFEVDLEKWKVTIEFSDGCVIENDYLGEREELCNACVVQNPYRNAPLVAQLQYESVIPERVEIIVLGQDGESSNLKFGSSEAEIYHNIDILGLYPNYNNSLQLIFKNKNGFIRDTIVFSIQTTALEGVIPEFEVIDHYNVPEQNMVFFINFKTTDDPIFLVDPYGKIRGQINGFAVANKSGFQKLMNGNYIFGSRDEPIIYEFNLMGQKINEWSLAPTYSTFHHDVIELPNGNFIIAADRADYETVEDILIEFDPLSGTVVNEWDMNEILPKRYTQIYNIEDWIHINAVIYDERDHTLIISGQRQGLLKVDWDNDLKWIISPPFGWDGYESYLFEPIVAEFDWNWTQHAPLIMPNGNLFFWENGFGRNFSSDNQYSRALEIAIYEENMTIEEVWSYGKERGDELFSPIVGDVDYFVESNTRLITSGSLSLDQIYLDSANITRFWRTEQLEKARIIEVDQNKNVLFEMLVKYSGGERVRVYRSEKIFL